MIAIVFNLIFNKSIVSPSKVKQARVRAIIVEIKDFDIDLVNLLVLPSPASLAGQDIVPKVLASPVSNSQSSDISTDDDVLVLDTPILETFILNTSISNPSSLNSLNPISLILTSTSSE